MNDELYSNRTIGEPTSTTATPRQWKANLRAGQMLTLEKGGCVLSFHDIPGKVGIGMTPPPKKKKKKGDE